MNRRSSSAEYAKITGRESETAETLRAAILQGRLTVDGARNAMAAQGFDPELVGAPANDVIVDTLRARVAAGQLTIDDGRRTAQALGLDADRIAAKPVESVKPTTEGAA